MNDRRGLSEAKSPGKITIFSGDMASSYRKVRRKENKNM